MTKPRRIETFLLLHSLIIATACFFVIEMTLYEKLSKNIFVLVLLIGGIVTIIKAAVKLFVPLADSFLVSVATLLTLLGLVMIYRLDVAQKINVQQFKVDAPSPDVYIQIAWWFIAIGMLIIIIVFFSENIDLLRYKNIFGFAGLLFLILPAIPFFKITINDSNLWAKLFAFTFQPIEIAKLLLIIYFAAFITHMKQESDISKKIWKFSLQKKYFSPLLALWFVTFPLFYFQKDLAAFYFLFFLGFIVLYITTKQSGVILLSLVSLFVSTFIAYITIPAFKQKSNFILLSFFPNIESESLLQQSLYGVANGGIFGNSLGNGYPELIPQAKTIYIGSALTEELGLIGITFILLLYIIIFQRGLKISLATKTPFRKYLSLQLICVLFIQTIVTFGSSFGLFLSTSLLVPFLSYGSASIFSSWIIIAFLLKISHDNNTQALLKKSTQQHGESSQ